MKKLSTLFITSIIIILNVTGTIFFFFFEKNKINSQIIIAFISYVSVYISFFYLSEIQNGKLRFYESKYFILFPINKIKIMQTEVFALFKDIKFYLILITSLILLLIVSNNSDFNFIESIISLTWIIIINISFLITIRYLIKVGKNINVIYIIAWTNFFVAYLPLYLTTNNYLNLPYDFISKYNPLSGLFFSLFIYQKNFKIIVFLIMLSLAALFVLYKKASVKWNI